jgi:hypothetical protein
MDYRCPKHDRIFEAQMDQRRPGSNATANLPAHPVDGHPECPKCAEDLAGPPSKAKQVAAARSRAAMAAAALAKAQNDAAQAAQEAAGVEADFDYDFVPPVRAAGTSRVINLG